MRSTRFLLNWFLSILIQTLNVGKEDLNYSKDSLRITGQIEIIEHNKFLFANQENYFKRKF